MKAMLLASAILSQTLCVASQAESQDPKGIHAFALAIPGAVFNAVRICSDSGFVVAGSFDGRVDFDASEAVVSIVADQRRGFLARYSAGGACRWVIDFGNYPGTGGSGTLACRPCPRG